MKKVYIKKENPKIKVGQDTFTEIDVIQSTVAHQQDVMNTFMNFLTWGKSTVYNHDETKLKNTRMFTEALKTNFKKDSVNGSDWFKDIHVKQERHHLNDFVPDDVNLIDVIEMLCDCVCAAKARNGAITKDISIKSEVLLLAVKNTVKILDNAVQLSTDPEDDWGSDS